MSGNARATFYLHSIERKKQSLCLFVKIPAKHSIGTKVDFFKIKFALNAKKLHYFLKLLPIKNPNASTNKDKSYIHANLFLFITNKTAK